jgi:hypothetical protein
MKEGKEILITFLQPRKRGYTKLYRKIPWDVYRGMELP